MVLGDANQPRLGTEEIMNGTTEANPPSPERLSSTEVEPIGNLRRTADNMRLISSTLYDESTRNMLGGFAEEIEYVINQLSNTGYKAR